MSTLRDRLRGGQVLGLKGLKTRLHTKIVYPVSHSASDTLIHVVSTVSYCIRLGEWRPWCCWPAGSAVAFSLTFRPSPSLHPFSSCPTPSSFLFGPSTGFFFVSIRHQLSFDQAPSPFHPSRLCKMARKKSAADTLRRAKEKGSERDTEIVNAKSNFKKLEPRTERNYERMMSLWQE